MSYSNSYPAPEAKPRSPGVAKQRALDRLEGHLDAPRRPLTHYESTYEVACDGALYSIRLQRFLKPVYNHERGAAELEFESAGETIRLSPGKAVALSFFSSAQRDRVAQEAFDIQPYDSIHAIKGHPAIERLAWKYDVCDAAVFYIMLASVGRLNTDDAGRSRHVHKPEKSRREIPPGHASPVGPSPQTRR